MLPEKGMKHVARLTQKWCPKSLQNRKRPWKTHAEIDTTFATFQKVPKIVKMSPRWDFDPKRAPRVEPGWWIFCRPPESGPKYTHASKERRGAAERKKKQQRKKGYAERGNKRDLNTQAARGPANCFCIDFYWFVLDEMHFGIICCIICFITSSLTGAYYVIVLCVDFAWKKRCVFCYWC